MESLEGVMKPDGKSYSGDPRMWYFDSTIGSECWGGLSHIFSIPKHLKPRQHIKKQRYYFAKKGPSSQSCGSSSSHVWMWELDHKESWVPKKWCFQIVVLEKTVESPLDSKIKPVNPKGNQPWIFIGRTDAEAEAPILGHLLQRADSLEKTDAGKDWGQEEKGATEDEIVGWHHQINEHEFEQTLGNSEG